MPALRNLAALRRNISNRIRQALQELQESLRNLDRSPVPQRVPVGRGSRPRLAAPQYGNVSRFQGSRIVQNQFQTFHNFQTFQSQFQVRFYSQNHSQSQFFQSRFFKNQFFKSGFFQRPFFQGQFNRGFSTPRYSFNQWKWRPNQLHTFSHRTQFRSKSFCSFYRAPTVTELLKKKVGIHEEGFSNLNRSPVSTAIRNSMPASIRLNVSLTEKFHNIVMDLARAPNCTGCYVDFSLEPKLFIPSATVLHADILQEMMDNLKRFERHVADLQTDLARLSELGELPLKYVQAERVVRVFFPNCDRDKVERLLMEKNVRSGVVHEDAGQAYFEASSSISEFDILSSCGSVSESASSVSESDILSSESDMVLESLVHVEPISSSDHVEIVDSWAY